MKDILTYWPIIGAIAGVLHGVYDGRIPPEQANRRTSLLIPVIMAAAGTFVAYFNPPIPSCHTLSTEMAAICVFLYGYSYLASFAVSRFTERRDQGDQL